MLQGVQIVGVLGPWEAPPSFGIASYKSYFNRRNFQGRNFVHFWKNLSRAIVTIFKKGVFSKTLLVGKRNYTVNTCVVSLPHELI